MSKISERADAFAAKSFHRSVPPPAAADQQNKLKESLQAVAEARARVLKMFGKR